MVPGGPDDGVSTAHELGSPERNEKRSSTNGHEYSVIAPKH